MVYVVYVDLLFLINFLIETILLTGYGILVRKKRKYLRIFAGGALGGLLAVFYYQVLWNYMQSSVIYHPAVKFLGIVPVFFLLLTAYPISSLSELFRHACLFFLVHILVYGMMSYLLGQWEGKAGLGGIALLAAACAIVFVSLGKKYRVRASAVNHLYEIELVFHSAKVRGVGFYDTGNTLHDPIFGHPVMIAEKSWLQSKGISLHGQRVQMIPYHSIGKERGLLPAVTADKLYIYKEETVLQENKVLVALKEGRLSAKGTYQALLHADFL